MLIFIVFKLQPGEIKNAYSLVTASTVSQIEENNPGVILAKKEVENKLYSTEELEALRDEVVNGDN